jgi:hypothetical protein
MLKSTSMTKTRAAGPVYAVELQAHGADGVRALRLALKILWRRYQLKCVSAVEVSTTDACRPDKHSPASFTGLRLSR